MTDIERITDMEQCFDRVDRALRALEETVSFIWHSLLPYKAY